MREAPATEATIQKRSPRLTRLISAAPSVAACLLVLAIYLWTVATAGIQVLPDGTNQSAKRIVPRSFTVATYYNMLAGGFLAGHLYLTDEPPKELLALADPYNPATNEKYRLHDASLYKGKYYLYFGLTPVVVLYIPFRVLHLGGITDAMAVLIFGYGGFLWTVLLLRHLIQSHLPNTKAWMEAIAIVALGICNFVPFLLRRPVVYEVAIACSYFFVAGGTYLLFTGYIRRAKWRLLLASLFFGLSVGARPTDGLTGLLLLAVWIAIFVRWHGWRLRPAIHDGLMLSIPFTACVMLLGLYNFARFGSMGEFGTRYQLSGGHVATVRANAFKLRNIWPGLHNYFFQPCDTIPLFPFFQLKAEYPLPLSGFAPEVCGGIFPNLPITTLLVLLPLLILRERRKRGGSLLLPMLCMTAVAILIAALTSYALPATTIRYLVDFAPALLLVSLVLWLYWDSIFVRWWMRISFRAITIVAIAYGCLFAVGISMESYFNCMQFANPELYNRLECRSLPISNVLANFTGLTDKSTLGTYCNSGVGKLPDGSNLFWIGEQSVKIVVYMAKPSVARLQADCLAGRGLSRERSVWHMVVRDNGAPVLRQATTVPGSVELKFPLERGFNVIQFDLEEKGKDVAIAQEMDRGSPLLIGLTHMNLRLGGD